MDTKTAGEGTAITTSPANGRTGRRRAETNENVRYFLSKPGAPPDRPELGREMATEAEALVESFRTGQPFYTLGTWKAVPEMSDVAPKIVKEVLKRS